MRSFRLTEKLHVSRQTGINRRESSNGLSEKRRRRIQKKTERIPQKKESLRIRRITGNCAKHQRALTLAVKRARHLAILPYVQD